MPVTIRRFEKRDIPDKVTWVNDTENNRFLHYDLPLEIEKTEKCFDNNQGRTDRFDGLIECDGVAVGLIGLLSIDKKSSKAEYYILLGRHDYKGRGIAKQASRLIIEYGFNTLGLNRIYLFTEKDNVTAQRLFERVGFVKEGCLRGDILSHGQYADRYVYGIMREDWEKTNDPDSDTGIR